MQPHLAGTLHRVAEFAVAHGQIAVCHLLCASDHAAHESLLCCNNQIHCACSQTAHLFALWGLFRPQGEEQKKLDVISNDIFCNCLRNTAAAPA